MFIHNYLSLFVLFFSIPLQVKFLRTMIDGKYILIEVSEFKALIKEAVAEALAERAIDISINTREEDDLIGTAEACKLLGGISERTMQRYRDGKYFTVVMAGPKKAMYYRSEILAFRDAHTRANRNNLK